MKIHRVLLAAAAAVMASFAFSSCVNEAPEINYVVEYTHNSDFSSIIAAINSQTTSIAEKLAAVETAVNNGFLSMEEASGALKDALVESLNNQNATLSDIQQAIASQNLLLEDKLDVLNAAIATQTATLDDALEAIEMSVDYQTDVLKAKLDLLAETIETGAVNLVDALNEFEETVDEGFGDVTQATNAQTMAMGIMTASIVRAINNGVITLDRALADIEEAIDDQTEALEAKLDVIAGAIETGAADLVDALEAFEDTMEEGLESVADATNAQTLANALIAAAIIQSINDGFNTLEDALADIEEAIDDQTDAMELQAGLIIDALDSGAASIADVAEALSNLYDNIAGFEPLLGDYYQKIYNALLLIAGEEPEEEPLYYVKENVPGLFMNGAGYRALENAPDVRAAYLLKKDQYAVDAPLIEYTGTFSFNSSMNYEGLTDQYASVTAVEITDDPDQSYIVYTVEDADADGEGFKHVLFNETVAKVSVTGYHSTIALARRTTHTLIYSTDGGTTWSNKITYDTRGDLILYLGTAYYKAYIPLEGVTNVMFNYGE